jgi:HEAT repeat protein
MLNRRPLEALMLARALGALSLLFLLATGSAFAQSPSGAKEPVSKGRPLSEWIADLKGAAPSTRNAAAYEIASMGPAAAAAVPALIEALGDPDPAVRFPVTVALGEMGPAAKAAVPRLQQMMFEEINDEITAGARRAIRRIEPSALAGQ